MTRRHWAVIMVAGLVLCALGLLSEAHAAEQAYGNNYTRYYGSGANDNDILFTTGDLARFDACVLMSTAGTVDVYASLDGTNFSTAALSLEDKGSTSLDPVLQAAPNRIYGFVGKFAFIRVLQVGATAASASINCWKL